jgi:hypothetical protein
MSNFKLKSYTLVLWQVEVFDRLLGVAMENPPNRFGAEEGTNKQKEAEI